MMNENVEKAQGYNRVNEDNDSEAISEEKRCAQSWSGSERQRREQGVCLPPKGEPDKTPRFLVKSGTKCWVRHISKTDWTGYTTKRDSDFERFYRYHQGCFEFRQGAWIIRVKFADVVKRDD